jgi:hypothetical protein
VALLAIVSSYSSPAAADGSLDGSSDAAVLGATDAGATDAGATLAAVDGAIDAPPPEEQAAAISRVAMSPRTLVAVRLEFNIVAGLLA